MLSQKIVFINALEFEVALIVPEPFRRRRWTDKNDVEEGNRDFPLAVTESRKVAGERIAAYITANCLASILLFVSTYRRV